MAAGPHWAAFAGITFALTSLLLGLARLSQPAVSRAGREGDSMAADGDLQGRHGFVEPTPGARPPPSGALLLNVALSQGIFGFLLLVGAWYTAIPPAALGVSATPSSTGLSAVALGIGVGLVLSGGNALASRLAEARGVDTADHLRALLTPETPRGWLLLLGVALPVVAFVEELLFRAALIGALSTGFAISPWPLALVSSVAFAVAHGAQGPAGVVVAGALGLALAVAFVLTDSLLVVVIAHYLVNVLEFLGSEDGPGIARRFM